VACGAGKGAEERWIKARQSR